MDAEPTCFEVIAGACIRCAGCATIAPGLFRVGATSASLVRQPASDDERDRATAAALLCPTSAIARRPAQATAPATTDVAAPAPGILDEALCYGAMLEAEGARWRMADLPLDLLDRAHATPELRRLVREAALSELTTFSASRQFLQEFADDADLSQWIAVWLYEESRHPQAMIRWLAALGESVAEHEIVRARVTTPFVKSRTGTLVMNVVSEAIAATRYLTLARLRPEPALTQIARWLAADEARHGATFYAYARRRLQRAQEPEADRLDALKILYFWLFEGDKLQHPVNLFQDKARTVPDLARATEIMAADGPRLQRRVCDIVGHLIGIPLDGPESVRPAMRQQAQRVRSGRAAILDANPDAV